MKAGKPSLNLLRKLLPHTAFRNVAIYYYLTLPYAFLLAQEMMRISACTSFSVFTFKVRFQLWGCCPASFDVADSVQKAGSTGYSCRRKKEEANDLTDAQLGWCFKLRHLRKKQESNMMESGKQRCYILLKFEAGSEFKWASLMKVHTFWDAEDVIKRRLEVSDRSHK